MRIQRLIMGCCLLFSISTVKSLSPRESSILFHSFDFALASTKPGSPFAFRLKRDLNLSGTLCFRQECLKATHSWQLFVTDPNIQQKQYFLIEDDHHRWALRAIALRGSLFDQSRHAFSKLRLPSSVVENLNEGANQIPEDLERDQKLFSQSQPTEWSSQWRAPVAGILLSDFWSSRQALPGVSPYFHTGVDLRASMGTPVKACSDGIIISEDKEVIYGNVITIDHGFGVMSRYMHLSGFRSSVGEHVKAGEIIAWSGATGRAEGPHLHWEIRVRGRPADPLESTHLLERLAYLE